MSATAAGRGGHAACSSADGLSALSARRLAAETGTSTMAVYTHFGGMTGARRRHRRRGVRPVHPRADRSADQTDDPVADFLVMGVHYRDFALANPHRYQMMFGTSRRVARPLTAPTSPSPAAPATARISRCPSKRCWQAVRRMIAAGRIRDDGESAIAGRLWSVTHGEVMLEIAGFFGHEGHGVTQILAPLTVDVLVGMGDDRDAAQRSLVAVVARVGEESVNR